MIFGRVRPPFPRVNLTLPGLAGPIDVEFIVDTAFDGDLAVPAEIARRLDAQPSGSRGLSLANGSFFVSGTYELMLEWDEEERLTDVLVLEGNPLLGVTFMAGFRLNVDMEPGGEVLLEPI
jgi:predicted aspartyl protease